MILKDGILYIEPIADGQRMLEEGTVIFHDWCNVITIIIPTPTIQDKHCRYVKGRVFEIIEASTSGEIFYRHDNMILGKEECYEWGQIIMKKEEAIERIQQALKRIDEDIKRLMSNDVRILECPWEEKE